MTDPTNDQAGRTALEVREYLLTQLNAAMRRPGMYGGEMALRLYLDAVAFADDVEQAWHQELRDLQSRQMSFSTGVHGAFQDLWGDAHEGAVASVYAEIAHRHAWLRLDRALTTTEYDDVCHTSSTWCREDRFLSDIVTAFGPPSVLFGGSNPNYPKTLAYAAGRREDPLLCFHLWNGLAPSPSQSPTPVHTEPVLWAFRAGGDLFIDGFTFTPEGSTRRSQSSEHAGTEFDRGE
jgi:hypothetical protein